MTQDELIATLKKQDFEAVISLAQEFGRQARAEIQAAPTAAKRVEIYETSTSAISDALRLARVLRSQIATELFANSASFLYGDTDLQQPHWQIKG